MASPSTSTATLQRVPTRTIQRAIDALIKWRNTNSNNNNDNDQEFLYLVLTLKKIPQNGVVATTPPKIIPLPHSLLSPSSQTCLILDDRPKKPGPTKPQAQSKITAENVAVSTVLKLSKLASDYQPFEAKRKLCDSYDVFFADKRIVSILPRLLGKQFSKKKKVPLPLDLRKGDWKVQVERACSSVVFSVGNGTCSVVRVAKLSMARDEIVANVVAAIEGVVEAVPKKWSNVRSFHVKLLESLALPMYQAAPDLRLRVEGGTGEEKKEEENEKKQEEGEKKGVKMKKGMIGEIRYMDGGVDEDCVDDELGSEDRDDDWDDWGVVSKEEDLENDEKCSRELASKKRKKGDNRGLNELSSIHSAMKGNLTDRSRNGE